VLGRAPARDLRLKIGGCSNLAAVVWFADGITVVVSDTVRPEAEYIGA